MEFSMGRPPALDRLEGVGDRESGDELGRRVVRLSE